MLKVLRIAVGALLVSAMLLPFRPAGAAINLRADLSGLEEIPPGSGDHDGDGVAFIDLKKSKRKVCWQVSFNNIDNPTVGHIHSGALGQEGPPVVTLFEEAVASGAEGCTRAKRGLIRDIGNNPANFYVNLHNAAFPDGAIRGQLGHSHPA